MSWQAYREHGLAETLNTFRHEVAHIVHPNHSAAFWELAHALGVTQRYASAPADASRPQIRLCLPRLRAPLSSAAAGCALPPAPPATRVTIRAMPCAWSPSDVSHTSAARVQSGQTRQGMAGHSRSNRHADTFSHALAASLRSLRRDVRRPDDLAGWPRRHTRRRHGRHHASAARRRRSERNDHDARHDDRRDHA